MTPCHWLRGAQDATCLDGGHLLGSSTMSFFSETQKDLGSRGVVGFSAHLFTKELRINREFRDFLGSLPHVQCGPSDRAFTFGFISKTASPFGVYITCHCRLEDEVITSFNLDIGRKPTKGEPPSELATTSERLGGYPKGFQKIIGLMNGQRAKFSADFTGLVADAKRWPVMSDKPELPETLGKFSIAEQAISFSSENDKITGSVVFHPGSKEYLLKVASPVEIELNDTCFDDASEQLFNKVKSIFEIDRKAGKRERRKK